MGSPMVTCVDAALKLRNELIDATATGWPALRAVWVSWMIQQKQRARWRVRTISPEDAEAHARTAENTFQAMRSQRLELRGLRQMAKEAVRDCRNKAKVERVKARLETRCHLAERRSARSKCKIMQASKAAETALERLHQSRHVRCKLLKQSCLRRRFCQQHFRNNRNGVS